MKGEVNIMSKIKTFIKLVKHPKNLIKPMVSNELLNWVSDEKIAKMIYKAHFGKELNLSNPTSFNEKLQWMKLYYREPIFTTMVDKYKVRQYIKDKIGEQYLIPLLGVWNNANEIDFEKLPQKFVLKCNHDQGSVVICKDKSTLDINKTRKYLNKRLSKNHYWATREWPYKNIKPCIICEKYMTNNEKEDELSDYKVLCFGGKAKLIEVHKARFTNRTQDFYDIEWNKLNISQPGINNSEIVLPKPYFLDEMIKLSEKLSNNYPHIRVDWYCSNGKLLFSELTFYDGGGFDPFNDDNDEKIGSWLVLPEKVIRR